MQKSVVIMGAGVAGLAAGYTLIGEKDINIIVLEKDHNVGGLARTIKRNNFSFDLGGHRWFTKNDELNDWLRVLMGDELLNVRRISRIYYDKEFYLYPVNIRNILRNAGFITCTKAIHSYLVSQLSHYLNGKELINMEDAYTRQFGRKLYEMFFKRYSEKVWGRECRYMSADWVAQRTRGLSLFATLSNAIFNTEKKVVSLTDSFFYPEKGFGHIPDKMAHVIKTNGGRIELNKRIYKLLWSDNRITSICYTDDSDNQYSVTADEFISSIPITTLVRLLDPEPPGAVLNAADRLEYRDLITVNIMLDMNKVTDDTWLYIHDSDIKFGRLHEPKNWSKAMAPAGKTSVVAEYFCTEGDNIWNLTDKHLCDYTVKVLSNTLGFIDQKDVIDSFAIRIKKAYPCYTIGYGDMLETIKIYLQRFSNLQMVGRNGIFRYNNTDHSVETGIKAAKNLLGEKQAIDVVNILNEYHEEKKI